MPEGDTVWNTARLLRRWLVGGTLTATDFRVPRLAAENLAGWTVVDSACRGKHLLLRLAPHGNDSGSGTGGARRTLHSHLRMDGAWRVYAPGERWQARPSHLIRAVLRTADAVAVGYHLHDLALVPTAEEAGLVGHLGPDLLGPDWNPTDPALPDAVESAGSAHTAAVRAGYWVRAEAVRGLLSRPDRTVGEAVIDQRVVAGLGTVYRAELLFLRGVDPWTAVCDVREPERLLDLARRLIAANRDRPVRVTTGDARRGRQLWVYGRGGEPCRRCGTPVRQGSLGPAAQERIVYWCPTCQPGSHHQTSI